MCMSECEARVQKCVACPPVLSQLFCCFIGGQKEEILRPDGPAHIATYFSAAKSKQRGFARIQI